jgi:hypothetical protein
LSGGLANKVVILHKKNANERLKEASRLMGMASKYNEVVAEQFNKMAAVKISDEKLKSYIEQVLRTEVISKEKLEKEYSTLFVNRVNEIYQFAHEHPTQLTEAAKGTVWGAYNSISGYHSYLKEYKSQEQKMNDLYFKGGMTSGAAKIEKAYDLAVALI